jgi:asparagine synthase (glutamine-hydrolysing)
MCGIAGILNLREAEPVSKDTILSMLATLRHRGPDGFGVYRDRKVGLGSARLSIIDLSGGDQPIGNEDSSLWIVFNGEIFNYVELRPELEKRGHHFSTHSDTEVILHLYEDLGPGCLRFLNGQFALAVWDVRGESLFLARDRVGVRPLFYTSNHGKLVFGSEVKSLLACPGVQAEINPQALRETFTYWSPQRPHSIFDGIVELPPGHFLIAKDGEIKVESYWDLNLEPESPVKGAEETLEEFESLLIDATQIRLRADVPVGAYLSGGLDSSVTTALIRKYNHNRLDTFSISFSDANFDESSYQKLMVDALGTDHHEVFCNQRDIGAVFPDVIWHTETPILRTAPAPMFLLSKLVRENHFKVVLTGEGADEFLAGYDIFKEMKLRRFWARDAESTLRPRLLARLYPDIRGLSASGAFLSAFFKKDLMQTQSPFYSHSIRWSNTARTLRFLNETYRGAAPDGPDIKLPDGFANLPALSQAQTIEILTFLSPYLLSSQGDRMAMAHSVEGRYPFLDYRVIEFCNRLPSEYKMPGLTEKWLLKRLGQKYVPDAIWQRVKRPYRAPIQQSFFPRRAQAFEYVADLLSESVVRQTGIFEAESVTRLARKAASETVLSEVEEMALVGILSTQLVDQLFVHASSVEKSVDEPERCKIVDRLADVYR